MPPLATQDVYPRFLKHLSALIVLSAGLANPAWAESESVILPVFGSQPDTGLQFGGAGFWTASPAEDAPGASVFFIGTLNNQYRLSLGGRIPGVVDGQTDYFEGELFVSQFPSEFYGYRSSFLAEGEGVSYDEGTLQLKMGWFYPLNQRWRAGVSGLVAGSDVTFDEPDSELLEDVNWREGGTLGGVELSLTRDTRDVRSWPEQGARIQSLLTLAADDAGDTFAWASQSVAIYTQVQAGVVLAWGGQVQAATSDTPFQFMPTLAGSQWLRGVRDGQFRHQSTVATQVEARFPLSPRFAATTFVHTGQVADSPANWWEEDWKRGGGLGLRYSVSDERRNNIRLDMGWVDGRRGVVISFGEAF